MSGPSGGGVGLLRCCLIQFGILVVRAAAVLPERRRLADLHTTVRRCKVRYQCFQMRGLRLGMMEQAVAVQYPEAVQQLSRTTRRAGSRPGTVSPISLGAKQMGARSAGIPHAACDVEGAGNVVLLRYPGRTGAPVLDPTGMSAVSCFSCSRSRFSRISGLCRNARRRPTATACLA